MPGTIAPFPKHQFFTNAGDPAASLLLFTYASGTTTKLATYTDQAVSVANTNPIVLDSAGRATIFLSVGQSYKFVLAPANDSDPPVSPLWTVDAIDAVPASSISADTDVQGTAGETLAAGEAVYLSDGSGGGTVGRWYLADSDNTYSSTAASVVGFATEAISTGSSGAIRVKGRITGLSGLTAGTVYYVSATAGALTSSAPTNARAILQADATTAGVVISGEPYASATVQGVVSTGAQTLAGAKTFSSAIVASSGVTYTSGASIIDFATARLSSNFTKNADTTLANVTGLAVSVGANQTWEMEFIMFGISTTTADWKFTLTGPSAPTAVFFGVTNSGSPASTIAINAFGSIVTPSGSGVNELLVLKCYLRNGANAGTVQLQAAQNTSDASNTIIFAESYVTARRLV